MTKSESVWEEYESLLSSPSLNIGEAACLCIGLSPRDLRPAYDAGHGPLIRMVEIVERAIKAGLIDDLGDGWVRRDDLLNWFSKSEELVPEALQEWLEQRSAESEAEDFPKDLEPDSAESKNVKGKKRSISRESELNKLIERTLLGLRKESDNEPSVDDVIGSLRKYDEEEIIHEIDLGVVHWVSRTGNEQTTIRKTIQNTLARIRRRETKYQSQP